MVFRRTRRSKVDRSDELESDDADHQNRQCKQNTLRELALWRVTIVHHTEQKQVAETGTLTIQRSTIKIERIELLRQILP